MTGEQRLRPAPRKPRLPVAADSQLASSRKAVDRRYLTIEEAAAYLNVSVRFMRRIVCSRRLRHYKVGKFLRFDPADLDAFAEVKEPSVGPDTALASEVWRQRQKING